MKRIISLFLMIVVLYTTTIASMGAPVSPKFVALGDSITTGYGLEGYITTPPYAKDSFVSILSQNTGEPISNFAADGMTSTMLAKAVADPTAQQALHDVQTVSITVGGNDLLNPLFVILGTNFGMNPASPTFANDIRVRLAQAFNGGAGNDDLLIIAEVLQIFPDQLGGIVGEFQKNINTIVAEIKQASPNARIIIQTLANPYKDIPVPEFASAIDTYFTTINNAISAGAAANNYIVADVYTAFKNSTDTLVNATNPEKYLDPHPNAAGHAVIAGILKAIIPSSIPSSYLPENYTLYTGGRVTWDKQPAGGTWTYDNTMLEKTSNGNSVVFKALKAGKTTVSYTVDGITSNIAVTINEATLPVTGQNFEHVYLLAALTLLSGAATIMIAREKRV